MRQMIKILHIKWYRAELDRQMYHILQSKISKSLLRGEISRHLGSEILQDNISCNH